MFITKSILQTGYIYRLVCRLGLHQYSNKLLLLKKAAFAVGAARIGLLMTGNENTFKDWLSRQEYSFASLQKFFFAFMYFLSVKTKR